MSLLSLHVLPSRLTVDTLVDSDSNSEPVSCDVIEQDCALGLDMQIFSDMHGVGITVVFLNSYPYAFMPYSVKGVLEEILLMMQVFLAENPAIKYLLLALKLAW